MREVRLLMPEEQADHLHAWALTWMTDTSLDQRLRKGLSNIYFGLARAQDAEDRAAQGRDTPPAPACERCAFWVANNDPECGGPFRLVGECRRAPPVANPAGPGGRIVSTRRDYWCGEFRERGGDR